MPTRAWAWHQTRVGMAPDILHLFDIEKIHPKPVLQLFGGESMVRDYFIGVLPLSAERFLAMQTWQCREQRHFHPEVVL
jgi:hypothetical protein